MDLLLLFKLRGADIRFVKIDAFLKSLYIYKTCGQQFCFVSFIPLPGFTDHSPEEIRLEYYSSRASGDLQGYVSVALLIYTCTLLEMLVTYVEI